MFQVHYRYIFVTFSIYFASNNSTSTFVSFMKHIVFAVRPFQNKNLSHIGSRRHEESQNFQRTTIVHRRRHFHTSSFCLITRKRPQHETLVSYSTSRIFIFSFLSKNQYAARDTTVSKALPIPNSNAMPINEGAHTPTCHKMNAVP